MIQRTMTKANNIMMFKRGQKDNKIIQGTLENKKNQSNLRKQNESKIEIELNENQINNTNYDVQSCNDKEAPSGKRINDDIDFDENTDDDDDKERQDAKGEAEDSNVQTSLTEQMTQRTKTVTMTVTMTVTVTVIVTVIMNAMMRTYKGIEQNQKMYM